MNSVFSFFKKYPGILVDVLFVSGILHYFIRHLGPMQNRESLFFLLPLLQVMVLALAAALQKEEGSKPKFKKIILICLFIICTGPLFYVGMAFFGLKASIVFLFRGVFIGLLMVMTWFIAEIYYKNLAGSTSKPSEFKLARLAQNSIAKLQKKQWLATLLLTLLLPLYWHLLQRQMGFSAVSTGDFMTYWNHIFYSGLFFLMFYFLAYRILLLVRPPYTYVELVTATFGFLVFIGVVRF